MEKYYDLIASLVKSHRKFSGCESILDDIVQDVYSHAEVVLNTVTNESVIESYLNKIVSTSMITVPKKLGINAKREDASTYEDIIKASINHTQNIPEPELESASKYSEPEEILSEDSDIDMNDQYSELSIKAEQNDDLTSENVIEINIENESTNFGIEPDVNMELVDKMINGVPDIDVSDDTGVVNEVGDSDNNAEESDLGIFEENQQEDLLIEETIIDSNELITDSNIEFIDELIVEDNDKSENEIEKSGDDSEISKVYSNSIYSRFNYIPEKQEINCDEILSEIEALDLKNPDKHIKEICELKYGKMLSISEIAEKLNINENDVLESLNEIVYAIKE